MPTDTHSLSRGSWKRSWPEKFTRQHHKPEVENKTYFEFLRNAIRDLSELPDKIVEDEDEDDEDENEFNNEDDKNDDHNTSNGITEHNKVRVFMTGLEGDDQSLQHDKVELVATFCERPSGENKKAVALLDFRNNGRSMRTKHGKSRPYLGPLTVPKLVKELSKPRFNTSTNAFDNEEVDAERCLIFINDLNPSSIEALATTASLSQVPALRSLFHKHLTGSTSIDVDIPSQGPPRFTLEFCLPYFVLKSEKKQRKDPRAKSDGSPLRHSWKSCPSPSSSSLPTSTEKVNCVYGAHTAIAVTGIDHQVWTAYGFADTYFGCDSVYAYRLDGSDGSGGNADPLSAGRIDVSKPYSDPRQYFFKILESRMQIVEPNFNEVVTNIEEEIKQSRANHSSASALKIRQRNREQIRNWVTQKMKELRIYKDALSEIDAAWIKFKETELQYFDDIEDVLGPSFQAIDKAFINLKGLLRKVDHMIEELCQDYPQGVHAQLSFENNEAAVFQQRSANHIQVLAYMTILFNPVALASSLFSMPGVLPFTPDLTHFARVLVILIIVVVVMLIALFKWETYLQPVLKSFHRDTASPLMYNFYSGISGLASESMHRSIEISFKIGRIAWSLARGIFSRRHGSDRELEMGELNGVR